MDADVTHYRNQVGDLLDRYCAGTSTLLMTIPGFMCLLPVATAEVARHYETTLTVMLQDLAEAPEIRPSITDRLVNWIVEERTISQIIIAIHSLKQRGVEISVVPGVNHFYLDDEGPFTLRELIGRSQND